MTFIGEQGPELFAMGASERIVPLPVRDEAWRQLECTCQPDRPEESYTPGSPRCEGWSTWMGTTFD
jgi:hypothetical protein